jgi:hypothetical protein
MPVNPQVHPGGKHGDLPSRAQGRQGDNESGDSEKTHSIPLTRDSAEAFKLS